MRSDPDSISSIGDRIRVERKVRGWSTRVAAQRLGLSVRFLAELERGKATARMDKVQQALEGLGLKLEVASARGPATSGLVLAQKRLLRTIATAHGVRSMSLFGSTARGEAGPASDLDFVIELEKGRSLVDLVGVKHDLEALYQRRVDVFTRGSLKPHVLASAKRDLVRVL